MVAAKRGLLLAALVAAVGVSGSFAADPPATQPAPAPAPAPMASLPRMSATAVPARRALAMTISELNVDNIPLARVIEYLRDTSGANIAVNWRVLEAANVTKDTPVTLSVANVPLRKVLRLALDQASPTTALVFNVESNVIEITSQEEADKVLITRVYIVDDLIMTPNAPTQPPQLDLQKATANGNVQGGGGGAVAGGGGSLFTTTTAQPAADQDTPQKRGQDLVKLIETVVRPTIWRENGGTCSIVYFSGKLVVTAPQSVQEAIGGPMAPEGGQRLGGM